MKLILIGCGSVGTSILELLTIYPRLLKFKIESILVIEPKSQSKLQHKYIISKITFPVKWVRTYVTKTNMKKLFDQYIDKDDIVIDVSVNTGTLDILKYIFAHNIKYINTSMETWADENDDLVSGTFKQQLEFTTYRLHYKCELLKNKVKHGKATVILEHGMNPGLISHFTKHAIRKLALRVHTNEMKSAIKADNYPKMSYLLDVKIIQCSEKDTQICKKGRERKPTEFISTWAPMGLIEEGLELAQFGHGTHEKLTGNEVIPKYGPQNQFIIRTRGIDLIMKSAVPTGNITGYVIPHGEGETISRFLTYKDIYRPTTHYVYQHNKEGIDSVNYLKSLNYNIPENKLRVMYGCDVASGFDEVGALLIMKRSPKNLSYWSGSKLSIAQTRKLGFIISGPTSVQVGISLLAAINYCHAHPNLSMIYPEQMDSEWVLKFCKPFLGDIYDDYIDYHPTNLNYYASITKSN